MRVIVYGVLPYKRTGHHENLDVQSQPEGGTAENRDGWQPRQLDRFKLPRGVFQYYFTFEDMVGTAPPEAEGGHTWRRPHTFRPMDVPLYGVGGFRAETPETAPDQAGLEGRPWAQPKPLYNSYKANPWLYQNNVPRDTDAAPSEIQPPGWTPRPLWQYGKYNFIWQYIQNVGAETASGGAGGQWMVFWDYKTNYETRVLQSRLFTQNVGVSFSAQEAFPPVPSFTGKPLRGFILPRSVPYSYWMAGHGFDAAPAEATTSLSYIPRAIPQFVLPRGIPLLIFTNTAQDFSVPVSAQVIGRVTGLVDRPVHWPTIIR